MRRNGAEIHDGFVEQVLEPLERRVVVAEDRVDVGQVDDVRAGSRSRPSTAAAARTPPALADGVLAPPLDRVDDAEGAVQPGIFR